MYSYRHAFHAGNHADVLKHTILVATLSHMTAKDTPIMAVDTHAGAGLYRLDGDYAGTSGESADGIFKLVEKLDSPESVAAPIRDYIEVLAAFNKPGQLTVYPGSPFIIHQLLRRDARDKLKLFEMHPTDAKSLAGNVAQLEAGRQIAVARLDGFEGLKAFLPPPSRRAFVLIDPSYEIKSDYGKVVASIQDSMKRFATGVYMVWYPIIPRPEAHDLPRRLKTAANNAGKPWLHATLSIGQVPHAPGEEAQSHGLVASGVFMINPPHTLRPAMAPALQQMAEVLGRGRGQGHVLESS